MAAAVESIQGALNPEDYNRFCALMTAAAPTGVTLGLAMASPPVAWIAQKIGLMPVPGDVWLLCDV